MKITLTLPEGVKPGQYTIENPVIQFLPGAEITVDLTMAQVVPVSPPPPPPPVSPPPPPPPVTTPPVVTQPSAASPRAFTPAELHWRETASIDVVDVSIELTEAFTLASVAGKWVRTDVAITGSVLTLAGAPLGRTPLHRADGSDHDHLAVTRYRDCVVVENCWMRGTINYVGRLVVTINGTVALDQADVRLDLRCRTAPIRAGLPQYTPELIDKSMLPNYGAGATAQFSRTGKDFGVNGIGFCSSPHMGDGGGRPDIGLIWGQVLAYACNGLYWQDTRDAEDHLAVWPCHVCDEATGLPVDPAQQPCASVLDAHLGYHYAVGTNPITGKSASPYIPNTAHLTHGSVVAYLATGSDFDTEQLAFWASYAVLQDNAYWRGYGKFHIVKNEQTRQLAWCLAEYGYAAKLLPDGYPLKASFRQGIKNSVEYWWTDQYAPGKPCANIFGAINCFAYQDANGVPRGMAPWQEDFLTSALALQVQYEFAECTDWAKASAGFALGRITQMCPQLASCYNLFTIDPAKWTNRAEAEASNAELYATWAQAEADTVQTTFPTQVGVACGSLDLTDPAHYVHSESGLMYNASASPQSYCCNLQPAIAAAVDLGLPGASGAWATFIRLRGTPDFTQQNQFNIVPKAAP